MKFCALLITAALALATPVLAADGPSPEANQAFLADNAKKPGVTVKPSGLQYRVLHTGMGKRVGPGDTVQIQYSGTLINGSVFDGSSPGLPATYNVGGVVRGMAEALQLMHVGDRWQIVLPPSLALGSGSVEGRIPPNSILIFDLTLLSVTTPAGPAGTDPGISLSAVNREQGNVRQQGAILNIPQ